MGELERTRRWLEKSEMLAVELRGELSRATKWLAESRTECERLRAQWERLAELVRGASIAFQVDDGDCQQWIDDAEAALRDLDKEVQGE